jgi:hypothetical protein
MWYVIDFCGRVYVTQDLPESNYYIIAQFRYRNDADAFLNEIYSIEELIYA